MLHRVLHKLVRKDNPILRRRQGNVRLEVLQLEARFVPSGNDPLQNIDHFVVIYQENWSFDGLYGSFPGANGIANATGTALTQVDRVTGQPLSTSLPIYPGQVDDSSIPNNTTTDAPSPYDLGAYLNPSQKTGDIVHRFFQEQSQIDHGAMDKYIGWSDNTQAVMSHFDASQLPEGLLAQQYSMDDNFFHAAFGGSFLNHQFLVAAAAPVYPNAPGSMIATLAPDGQLALNPNGSIKHDGNITPIGGASFGDPNGPAFDNNYAVNTIFSDSLLATGTNLTTDAMGHLILPTNALPTQNDNSTGGANYIQTIGDTLDTAGVSWKWYSGGWNNALASSPSNPVNNGQTPAGAPVDPLFQWHHQPFAYYNNTAPFLYDPASGKFVVNTSATTVNADGSKHLEDENNFFADLAGGNLPAVTFIKPLGPDNEHPGYTNVLQGQQHVADIVHALQNSPDWAHTAIVITYDENGGRWDHVSAPDNNGIWGDGTRVPAIVISPYAKQGYVDHTEHDTLSILKTIEERYNLPALNTLDAHATDLSSNFQSKPNISLGQAYLQPDAVNVGKFTLVVLGTEKNDHIDVSLDHSGKVKVKIDNINLAKSFDAAQISRIEIWGQGGDDHIAVASSVTIPTMIFAGDGDNHIDTADGNTVVIGGAGDNHIDAGAGRNILVAGSGKAHIKDDGGQSILIAGTTAYGQSVDAFLALEAEWASSDTLTNREAALQTGVGGTKANFFALNAKTIFANGHKNHLDAGSGMDWFFADPGEDHIHRVFGQDILTGIEEKP
jgi:phospholipase C